MAYYHLYLMGSKCKSEFDLIHSTILRFLKLACVAESDVGIYKTCEEHGANFDVKCPIVAVCFKDVLQNELRILHEFLKWRIPIIPLRRDNETFDDFPTILKELNGLEYSGEPKNCDRIASAMLDVIGLLREQRRIFVSYRRGESTEVAVQLFEHLSASGFNVFLDTHSISPGVTFQDSLWHQLCDSDLVIMLDTPEYFASRWTNEEFGRAQSAHIYILRLVWPGHKPTELANLSQTLYLSKIDFLNNQLTVARMSKVAAMAEVLRAKSIASRHMMISGKLRTGVESVGGQVEGVGAFRAIGVSLPKNIFLWVYPVVGVPTAHLMNNIALRAENAHHKKPILMFDEIGVSKSWLGHLNWLNVRVPEVDFMEASNATGELTQRIDET